MKFEDICLAVFSYFTVATILGIAVVWVYTFLYEKISGRALNAYRGWASVFPNSIIFCAAVSALIAVPSGILSGLMYLSNKFLF